ncbi:hypothetical protein HDU76_009712, partial [Blyttiomyces sp. JEL0837]
MGSLVSPFTFKTIQSSETNLIFELYPEDIALLKQPDDGKIKYAVRIITYIANQKQRKQRWSSWILEIFVNEIRMNIQRKFYLETGMANTLPVQKEKDYPLDVTKFVKEGLNTVFVMTNGLQVKDLLDVVMEVQIVALVGLEQILEDLKGQVVTEQEVIRGINVDLAGDTGFDDVQMVNDHIDISLKCPLSHLRVSTPVRAKNCKHHNCFDLQSWLSVAAKGFDYSCPICQDYIDEADLVLDKFIERLLELVDPEVSTVRVTENGSWQAIGPLGTPVGEVHRWQSGNNAQESQGDVVMAEAGRVVRNDDMEVDEEVDAGSVVPARSYLPLTDGAAKLTPELTASPEMVSATLQNVATTVVGATPSPEPPTTVAHVASDSADAMVPVAATPSVPLPNASINAEPSGFSSNANIATPSAPGKETEKPLSVNNARRENSRPPTLTTNITLSATGAPLRSSPGPLSSHSSRPSEFTESPIIGQESPVAPSAPTRTDSSGPNGVTKSTKANSKKLPSIEFP